MADKAADTSTGDTTQTATDTVKPVTAVVKPAKSNADVPPVQTLTLDQINERVNELLDKRLADERKVWETEHVSKLETAFRKNYEIPKRRDTKIDSLRQKLKSGGKYKPADDDNTDPTSPGDLAALGLLDDEIIVVKDAKGNGLTLLDLELKRTEDRLSKRTPEKKGDDLATPPVNADGTTHFDAIRKQKKDEQAEEAERRKRGLERVFNTR
jgi:hypothetical protein